MTILYQSTSAGADGIMAAPASLPEGIFSLLDTDLYKLTMQCCILKFFPDVSVTYSFTNRTPDKKLSRAAFKWLQAQVDSRCMCFYGPFISLTCARA